MFVINYTLRADERSEVHRRYEASWGEPEGANEIHMDDNVTVVLPERPGDQQPWMFYYVRFKFKDPKQVQLVSTRLFWTIQSSLRCQSGWNRLTVSPPELLQDSTRSAPNNPEWFSPNMLLTLTLNHSCFIAHKLTNNQKWPKIKHVIGA